MGKIWDFLKSHRALLSYPLGLIAAGLAVNGQKEAGAVVGMIATWLHGAGTVESDAYHKGQ